jgi:hypothetical protein
MLLNYRITVKSGVFDEMSGILAIGTALAFIMGVIGSITQSTRRKKMILYNKKTNETIDCEIEADDIDDLIQIIEVDKTKLIECLNKNSDSWGSTEWDICVDSNGNVEIKHNTNQIGWYEIVDLYSMNGYEGDYELDSASDKYSWEQDFEIENGIKLSIE